MVVVVHKQIEHPLSHVILCCIEVQAQNGVDVLHHGRALNDVVKLKIDCLLKLVKSITKLILQEFQFFLLSLLVLVSPLGLLRFDPALLIVPGNTERSQHFFRDLSGVF